jgi:C-terminal processing protease CtpA/Prc
MLMRRSIVVDSFQELYIRNSLPRRWLCVLAVLLIPAGAGAQAQPTDSQRLARLNALGRVWGSVKYFHPVFMSQDIDWDSAAVVAIPRVNAARTSQEFRAAMDEMLAALGDRQTRVVAETDPTPRSVPDIRTRWETDSTLVISIPSFEDPPRVNQQLRPIAAVVRTARRIVFDLRGPAPEEVGYASTVFDRAGMSALLPSRSMLGPGSRRRMYFGFPPQFEGRATGTSHYWTAAYETPGRMIYAQPGNPPPRVVFVMNERSDVPEVAWALQRTGQGHIVVDGSRNTVPHPLAGIGWKLVDFIPIGEGMRVQVRTGEMVGRSGGPLGGDTLLAASADRDAPLQAALAIVRGEVMVSSQASSRMAFTPAPEPSYPEMRYPSLPFRLLAAYRWWAAIQFFYPHKAGMGEDWNAVMTQSLAELEIARDSTEYVLAVAKMRARIRDSHYNNPNLFGSGSVGVVLQYIEGLPVVIRIEDDSATRASGVAVGDVILTVDEELVRARKDRMKPYISASTSQSFDHKAAVHLLRGPVGSVAELTVRRTGNPSARVSLARRADRVRDPETRVASNASGAVIRIEPGNIGYADLTRLTSPMVDSMFETLKATKAIVFDMRGYPANELRNQIVERLSDRMVSPSGDILVVLSQDSTEATMHATGGASVPASTKRAYRGKTVLLIDERAQSAAEEMGLWLEAANKTTFIGSPTAGANGNVTSVVLPGGIRANFTGMVVRHGDGRPLQRIGLIPDILVRPTIAGIRAGRDEVLERALAVLRAAPR